VHAFQDNFRIDRISRDEIEISINGFFIYDLFHVKHKKLGELELTNNKLLLYYFKPSKFNIALAI